MEFAEALFRDMSRNNTTRAVEINSRMGSSFLTVSRLTLIGQISAPTPIKSKTLTTLLPITLPSNISVEPLAREEIETASSGALVPKAIMVSPMRVFETLKWVAIEDAPSTSQSAPLIRIMKPIINNMIGRIKSIVFYFFSCYVYIVYNICKKFKMCDIIELRANVAQLFRALPCQGRGRELESLHSHHFCGFRKVRLVG